MGKRIYLFEEQTFKGKTLIKDVSQVSVEIASGVMNAESKAK